MKQIEMCKTMLALQDEINTRVHPQWRQQNYPWHRAIWTECAELLDHHGWKWWKHTETDKSQVKLEVVDIWHFGLSLILRLPHTTDVLAQEILSVYEECRCPVEFLYTVEKLVSTAAGSRRFNLEAFYGVMWSIGMDLEELYRIYIGKNVLNIFRQDHGYKTGGYIKLWKGREDNEHLSEIMDSMENLPTYECIYEQLKFRYASATKE